MIVQISAGQGPSECQLAVAFGYTKAQCMEDARRYCRQQNIDTEEKEK